MTKQTTNGDAAKSDAASEFAEIGDNDFKKRLAIAIGSESTYAFAKRSGIPDSTLRNYKNSGSMPGLRHLLAIAQTANVTLDWLAAARGPMRFDPSGLSADTRIPAAIGFNEGDDTLDFTLLPRVGVRAAAGHGLVALTEEVTERLAFKTEWLHSMGLSPRYCGLLTASGNSQEPVIKNGSLLLVDLRPDQQIKSGCYYILVLDGDVLVKLVNRRIDGTIELKSHNPNYPTEVVKVEDLDKLHIPGRVVWASQAL